MPIIVVKFKEPIALEPPRARGDAWVSFFLREVVDQVTVVSPAMPVLVHYPDGHPRGYVRIDDGVEFAAHNIEEMTVIP